MDHLLKGGWSEKPDININVIADLVLWKRIIVTIYPFVHSFIHYSFIISCVSGGGQVLCLSLGIKGNK